MPVRVWAIALLCRSGQAWLSLSCSPAPLPLRAIVGQCCLLQRFAKPTLTFQVAEALCSHRLSSARPHAASTCNVQHICSVQAPTRVDQISLLIELSLRCVRCLPISPFAMLILKSRQWPNAWRGFCRPSSDGSSVSRTRFSRGDIASCYPRSPCDATHG